MSLPYELAVLQPELEGYAREFGLDFYETRFEMLDYDTLNRVAAYSGFPVRYPHWSFGMEYERLSKSYAYGLHRIYEMVINTDPIIAYLLRSNQFVDQKLVMLHVFGHGDFFKNNLWFAHTNRKMLDEMGNHATRIRRHVRRHSLEKVEEFIDAVLSLDNLIDLHAPGVRRRPEQREKEEEEKPLPRLKSDSDYMEGFINPPDFLEAQKYRRELDKQQHKHFPEQPERDVLLFLMENAPLENWQYDILDILREEAYYFAPQGQTKIMNEGWASYIHSHLMTTKALTVQEVVDYADHHSGTVAVHRGRLNPYKLGLELFRDIEDRWNRGAFGAEYEDVDNYHERKNWDRQLGLGREKVFEVRKIYNDVGFIDAFLTEDFVREHGLFSFDLNKVTNLYEIRSRDFEEIKKALLFNLTNRGQPILDIVDGNYSNRGELYLKHRFEGVPLDTQYSRDTMVNLLKIWGRPVTVETMSVDGDVIKLGVS